MASKPPAPQPRSRLLVLKQRSDFLKLMKSGHRLHSTSWLLLNFANNSEGRMRCGWTLPRQVGPAVVRNRLKRWSREYFRALVKRDETLPFDVNLVFRKAEDDFYRKLKYDQFAQVLDKSWHTLRQRHTEALEAKSRPVTRPKPRVTAD